MSNELYFIPILTKMFRSDMTIAKLKAAVDSIGELGKRPEYADGYAAFKMFASAIDRQVEEIKGEQDYQRIDGLLESHVADEPQLRQALGSDYDIFFCGVGPSAIEDPVVELYRDEDLLCSLSFERGVSHRYVRTILPGRYRLALRTGMVIWQGSLLPQQLIWSRAFPAQPVRLAADSGSAKPKPTWEITAGAVRLSTFAGLENGTLMVELLER